MNRLIWLPPTLTVTLLLAILLNANLGRPVRFQLHECDPVSQVLINAIGFSLYYVVLLLLLRRLVPAPLARGALAAGGAAAIALLLLAAGELPGKGGFFRFTFKDFLFDFPGYAAIAVADGLILYSPRDPEGCNPLAWGEAERSAQKIEWGAVTPSGRVLLMTSRKVDRGILEPREYVSLLSLLPDGTLDRAFSERFHRCADVSPVLDGERLIGLDDAQIREVIGQDGSALGRDGIMEYAAEWRAFGPEEWRGWDGTGALVAYRKARGGGLSAAVFSRAGERMRRTRAFALGPRFADPKAWHSLAPDGDGLLVAWYGYFSPRDYAGGTDRRPVEEVLATQLQRLTADGAPDPAFRLSVPEELSARLSKAWFHVERVVAMPGGLVLLMLSLEGEKLLAALDGRGEIRADPWIEVDGWIDRVVPLDDGRLAIVHGGESRATRVSVLVRHGRHRIERAPDMARDRVVEASRRGEALELSLRGELLHLAGDGRMLLRVSDGGGLMLLDGRGQPVPGFTPPPWLR